MAKYSKYSKSQIEALWVNAGGPRAQAKIAAAVALAESGGNPGAVNPEGPEHAEGLWQIKGQLVAGNPLDPRVSAANAVAKWEAAKGSFSPWTTYTGGEYKKYLGSEGEGGGLVSGTILSKVNELLGATPIGEAIEKNPVGSIEAGLSGISSGARFIKALTEPSTWLRITEGIGGIILFMVGLKTLTKGTPATGAANVAISQGRSVKSAVVKAAKVAATVAK